MVFTQTTFFDADIPYAFGKASQQINGFCPDGTGDVCVGFIDNRLSGVVKDNSFDIRNWAHSNGVNALGNPAGTAVLGANSNAPGSMQVLLPPANQNVEFGAPMPRSYTIEIITILAIAVVAAILAYTNPKIFAGLFKLFIGYELIVLIVSVVLILILLGLYLFKPTMF